MARINFEDDLFKDRRFTDLIIAMGSAEAAIGALVFSWLTAQSFWIRSDNGIPKSVWKKKRLRDEIIAVGLAEDRGDFIYISGSKEQFAWLRQCAVAGQASVAKRKGKSKNARSAPVDVASTSLLSSLNSKTKNNTCSKSRAHGCQFDLEAAYKKYPRKQGKSAGMKRLAREIKNEFDYLDLLTAIDRYSKSQVVASGYIQYFSTFASEWRDWLDPDAGKTVRAGAQNQFELKSTADVEAINTRKIEDDK